MIDQLTSTLRLTHENFPSSNTELAKLVDWLWDVLVDFAYRHFRETLVNLYDKIISEKRAVRVTFYHF